MKYNLLSYPISVNTPVYGADPGLMISALKQIKKNGSSNTYRVNFLNHSGTHLDAPKHFYDSGRSVSGYNISELIFSQPFVLSLPKSKDELIGRSELSGIRQCDILLIKTGFYRFRHQKAYVFHNPGFTAEAAELIRQRHPSIRAIGIDTISFSAYQNREAGRMAHRVLLKEAGRNKRSVLLVEDMDLSLSLVNLRRVILAPLFIQGVDSAPCTVIGEFK